ncbi:MAG: ATP-binding protein [Bacteroidota bacterium]
MLPPKPADLIDREAEWEALATLWGSDRPELAFVVGRRRIGKSYVLARFAQAVGGLYYQATRRTEAEQLRSMSLAVGAHFGDAALQEGAGFPDWTALFRYVGAATASPEASPLLLVLDEFPYLAEAAPALPSVLQEAWDHVWPQRRIKVVLSGSYVTAMERLEAADQPLYGRRTQRLVVPPFTPAEVGAFVPAYTPRDLLRAYGLFGHLPGHLALLNPDASLAENAAQLLLSPQSRLVDDAQHMLDAYLGEARVHYSIVEAVAQGAQTWSTLTKRVGRSGGALLRPLQWLDGMGLLERTVPITERDPARSKRAVYRLTDPYVLLWHRLIAPLVRTGSIGLTPPAVLWDEVLAPRLDDHMGDVFEAACRLLMRQTARHGQASVLPFTPLRVGAWWTDDASAQVDVVVQGTGGHLLVGECKWGPVTARHLHRLRQQAERVAQALRHPSPPTLALFTGLNAADVALDAPLREAIEANELRVFTADDLVRRLSAVSSS